MKKLSYLIALSLVSSISCAGGISDYNLILSAGQSLSIGHTNNEINPAINDQVLDAEKIFLFNGVRAIGPQYNQAISNSDVTDLVPFIEITRQTHAYSMLATLSDFYTLNDKESPKFIYAPHARGGKKIKDLSVGSEPFENGHKMISAGELVAANAGEVFNVPFITWIHGESNANSNKAEYKNDLRKLHNAYKKIINTANSLTKNPLLFMDQTGVSYGHDIAVTSWEYARDNKEAILVAPKYLLNRLNYSSDTDRTHLNTQGYIKQGEYFAKAIYQTYEMKKQWKPLEPINVTVSGSKVIIEMNIPEGKMVVDTQTLPEAPGYGFQYILPASKEVIIPKVSIDGDNLILDIGQPVEVGGIIDAGFTLDDRETTGNQKTPVTNIRDTSKFMSSVDHEPLHNWMVQFSWTITATTSGVLKQGGNKGVNIWSNGDIGAVDVEPFVLLGGGYDKFGFQSGLYKVTLETTVKKGSSQLLLGDNVYAINETGVYTFAALLCEPKRGRLAVINSYDGFNGSISKLKLKPILTNTNLTSSDGVLGKNIWPQTKPIESVQSEEFALIGGDFIETELSHSTYMLSYTAHVNSGMAYINIGDTQIRVTESGAHTLVVPTCKPNYSRLRISSGESGFTGIVSNVYIEAL